MVFSTEELETARYQLAILEAQVAAMAEEEEAKTATSTATESVAAQQVPDNDD